MFTYENETKDVTINGKLYKVRVPSAFEAKSFKGRFEGIADENAIDVYVDFFDALGLPKEVGQTMSSKGLLDLFAYLLDIKKN